MDRSTMGKKPIAKEKTREENNIIEEEQEKVEEINIGSTDNLGVDIQRFSDTTTRIPEARTRDREEKNEQKLENNQKITKTDGENKIKKIGFININGMNATKIVDLEEEWEEEKLDIIGIVETHIKGDTKWEGKYYKMEGRGRGHDSKKGGGIALMVRKEKGWIWDIISNSNTGEAKDIMVVKMENEIGEGEQLIAIICYMTTGNRPESILENKEKYRYINNIIEEYKEQEIIIMGDMNAHIGLMGERIDKQGELLLRLADERDMEITNITIAEGKVTWQRPNSEEKSAIDYVLVNHKARLKIDRVEIDDTRRIENHSDHNMIITDYKWTRKQAKKNNKKERNSINIKRWRRKNADWRGFKEAIQERGTILGEMKEQIHDSLMKRIRCVGEKKIEYIKQRCKTYRPWWNEEIKIKRTERKRINKELRKLKDRKERGEVITENEINEAKARYEKKKQETKVAIERAMRKEEKRKVEELNENKSNREWWNYLKGPQVKRGEKRMKMLIEGEETEDEEKIGRHIKSYWERIRGLEEDNIPHRIQIERNVIEGNQDITIKEQDIKDYLKKFDENESSRPRWNPK